MSFIQIYVDLVILHVVHYNLSYKFAKPNGLDARLIGYATKGCRKFTRFCRNLELFSGDMVALRQRLSATG